MYGIFSYDIGLPRLGYRHHNAVLDLEVVALLGFFNDLDIDTSVFAQPSLNAFMALGRTVHRQVGQRVRDLLADSEATLLRVHDQVLLPLERVTMHLPVQIGNYTDFYAGIHHAENVGKLFRPNAEPLLPNYRHLPVAYHGRASSIVVSGTPIHRPAGPFLGPDQQPVFGPTQALDLELELGLIIGKANRQGEPVPVAEAEDYIFGVALFNDWSARDIQRWEYQPLGPFLGKNFASSLAAWVVPFDELEPFRTAGPIQEPTLLPYLQSSKPSHFDLNLEVWLQTGDLPPQRISHTNTQHLYWSFAQMIAHHTISGCNLCVGDVLATGTISGTQRDSYGSLLELSWNGARPLTLADSSTRTFLHDGDTITLRGFGQTDGHQLTLGDVSGTIQPNT
ncbi:fumarylacetoacetate hydrolase [Spirosoma oryzae]|uniref:fumarylacetoacetase n=1 Tax=Spirosoma oryzae TaxID=1469603 RepID=A0A2T0T846_9BACT|nr:fumarylacetoacetase [Spirosoma oryzae]PRY41823.1 fumarylacetoacetate hydrolase [Spirosoma oryzae]